MRNNEEDIVAVTVGDALPLGVWTHIVATWKEEGDGCHLWIFVNGKYRSYGWLEGPLCKKLRHHDSRFRWMVGRWRRGSSMNSGSSNGICWIRKPMPKWSGPRTASEINQPESRSSTGSRSGHWKIFVRQWQTFQGQGSGIPGHADLCRTLDLFNLHGPRHPLAGCGDPGNHERQYDQNMGSAAGYHAPGRNV